MAILCDLGFGDNFYLSFSKPVKQRSSRRPDGRDTNYQRSKKGDRYKCDAISGCPKASNFIAKVESQKAAGWVSWR